MNSSEQDQELAGIILKSAYTSLSKEEEEKLLHYLEADEANRAKYRELISAESLRAKMAAYERRNENQEKNFQAILHELKQGTPVRLMQGWKKWAVAAAVLVVAGAGIWTFTVRQQPAAITTAVSTPKAKDILPGREGAVLTLDDGSVMVLDSLGNGTIASQQGTEVVLKNGQLAYHAGDGAAAQMHYNTLSTPKGREFKVLLPDGTQVWLNAASSIRYPTAFQPNERLVYITGEAYFEVAAKRAQPFKVQVNDGTAIEVLGTHFNINAYDDGNSKTTLLEGAVKVGLTAEAAGHLAKPVVLAPGQQAQVKTGKGQAAGGIKTVAADVDKVMSWRRGFFNFEDEPLENVMRQLARWYDLEVVYEGAVPSISFAGGVSRKMNLSGVLKALEDAKVHFSVEGRKITILP